MDHTTAAAAARLPLCIPTAYLDAQGRYCLAYPRSPWNPQRYLVAVCAAGGPDLECVHDDFGQLVPMRQRTPADDWASALSWRPVQPGALQ